MVDLIEPPNLRMIYNVMNLYKSRWLILTQYYPPEIGAPQIRLRALARQLSRRGLDVEVLTAMPNYPAGKIFPGYKRRWFMRDDVDGIPVRRVWVFAGTGKSPFVRLANYFSFTFSALVVALTGPRPDVMFVESQPLSLGLVALAMKWIRRVPYVYNVPDLQVDVARQLGFMSNALFLRVAQWLEDSFMKASWKVSTVTHCFIDHFVGRGIPRGQVTYLPNGADTDFLKPRKPSEHLLEKWSLKGKKVVLYVGTHAYYHGLDTLLDAAAHMRDQEDISFLMIGDGPERQRLIRSAEERGLRNVVFGSSPYEEMDELYSIAFASVATLRDVPVANKMRLSKIFPSLACGVPVVYAGRGEAADLIEQNGCGLAVQPESPGVLAASIKSLADDPAHCIRLGDRARRYVEEQFSWRVIVDRWLGELTNGQVERSFESVEAEQEEPLSIA